MGSNLLVLEDITLLEEQDDSIFAKLNVHL
jgi:hypothetical protein